MIARWVHNAAILGFVLVTTACAPVFQADDYAGLTPISPTSHLAMTSR